MDLGIQTSRLEDFVVKELQFRALPKEASGGDAFGDDVHASVAD